MMSAKNRDYLKIPRLLKLSVIKNRVLKIEGSLFHTKYCFYFLVPFEVNTYNFEGWRAKTNNRGRQ